MKIEIEIENQNRIAGFSGGGGTGARHLHIIRGDAVDLVFYNVGYC